VGLPLKFSLYPLVELPLGIKKFVRNAVEAAEHQT
jgi:hypothetical protein